MVAVSDQARLRAAFFRTISSYGFRIVEPALLQPAEPFLKLSGEGLKKRLFLTSDALGRELCLRPDYTLPIAMMHKDEHSSSQEAQYAYCGSLFRQRDGVEPDEFLQAGVESYGDQDRIIAETAIIQLVIRFLVSEGVTDFVIRLTDVALSDCVFDKLHVSPSGRRRLVDAYRSGMNFNNDIDVILGYGEGGLSDGDRLEDGSLDGLLTLLKNSTPDDIRASVKSMLLLSGEDDVLGRSIDDVADRLIEKTNDRKRGGLADNEKAFLSAFLSLNGSADQALVTMKRLSDSHGIALGSVLDDFEKRLDLLRVNGVSMSDVVYSPLFGNRLSYYSGLVFEIDRKGGSGLKPMAAGGRYDHLFHSLGSHQDIPAVGCSLWLDRVTGVSS